MLADVRRLLANDDRSDLPQKLASALSASTRDTDINGWYKDDSILGVIFTEISGADKSSILSTISAKVTTALGRNLDFDQANKIPISFYFFPKELDKQNSECAANAQLYPDLGDSKRFARFVKRMMDIAGSVTALIIFSPLFLLISVAIKLSSRGPILFKQHRVGQCGHIFTFLKFRSMYFVNDQNIHNEYVKRFISGKGDSRQLQRNRNAVYKITKDPRVTRVGTFLRKTSLDELPQFFNVLKGDMSLVGPRPPIPYELEFYDMWHRRRFLETKPGITGLWQVSGRSRTSFDDMVRLDLKYARAWSLWLDIKILLQTLRVVISGEGAY